MEVILLERVEKLGQMGDVVKVKSGYARNYLLPKRKALRATDENKRQFEERRAQLEADNLERRTEAEAVAKKMDGVALILVRQAGDAGQLYGSVNARDIADRLTEDGFTVDRRQVMLETPIKTLGLHPIRIALHPEVAVVVSVNVARSADEAKIQAKTGVAVVSADAAEDAAEAAQAASKAEAEAAEAAAEAATDAVAEQAEVIFEEGAAPEVSDEDAGEDDKAGDADKDAKKKGG